MHLCLLPIHKRVVRLPGMWRSHYRLLRRRGNGRVYGAITAYQLAVSGMSSTGGFVEFIHWRHFEPESWVDYALIPWWMLRYLFAWCWSQVWYPYTRIIRRVKPTWAPLYSRHTYPTPVVCPRCLWAGPERWLVHGYGPCGDYDVEPISECPRCGQEM